jgi:hypothetical protein
MCRSQNINIWAMTKVRQLSFCFSHDLRLIAKMILDVKNKRLKILIFWARQKSTPSFLSFQMPGSPTSFRNLIKDLAKELHHHETRVSTASLLAHSHVMRPSSLCKRFVFSPHFILLYQRHFVCFVFSARRGLGVRDVFEGHGM